MISAHNDHRHERDVADDDHLTPRELEVLKALSIGMQDAEIAAELFISVRTVHAHLRSIYSKLGVHSRSAATRYFVQLEVIHGQLMA
ncbi:MAG TPA: LuxR C-terminal-related transcriptional regulator [Candidatus Limnocylindrales bacterium]|nr:LuxR C-terminal-related transcriptional regulator [Candidatus Limnocylindrales bacterium]